MSEHLLSTEQVCEAYTELRARVTEMMQLLTLEQAQTTVPQCPQWTVKDCFAHMVGIPEDVINGQMEGVASEAWTDRQIQRHAQDSVADLLAVWDATQLFSQKYCRTFHSLLSHSSCLTKQPMSTISVGLLANLGLATRWQLQWPKDLFATHLHKMLILKSRNWQFTNSQDLSFFARSLAEGRELKFQTMG